MRFEKKTRDKNIKIPQYEFDEIEKLKYLEVKLNNTVDRETERVG